jgi:hypothetical protein
MPMGRAVVTAAAVAARRGGPVRHGVGDGARHPGHGRLEAYEQAHPEHEHRDQEDVLDGGLAALHP